MSLAESLKKQKEELQSKATDCGELIQSILVPIEIPFKGEKVRTYVALNAALITNANELEDALQQIDESFGVYVYRKQQTGFYNRGNYGGWKK